MSKAGGMTIGRAWTWGYCIILLDLRQPKSRIVSVSISAHSKAIVPLDLKEQMEISSVVMPTVVPMV
jgi:hypothetical protein